MSGSRALALGHWGQKTIGAPAVQAGSAGAEADADGR